MAYGFKSHHSHHKTTPLLVSGVVFLRGEQVGANPLNCSWNMNTNKIISAAGRVTESDCLEQHPSPITRTSIMLDLIRFRFLIFFYFFARKGSDLSLPQPPC